MQNGIIYEIMKISQSAIQIEHDVSLWWIGISEQVQQVLDVHLQKPEHADIIISGEIVTDSYHVQVVLVQYSHDEKYTILLE